MTDVPMEPRRYSFSSSILAPVPVPVQIPVPMQMPVPIPEASDMNIARTSATRPIFVSERTLEREYCQSQRKATSGKWNKESIDKSKINYDDLDPEEEVYEPYHFEVNVVVLNEAVDFGGSEEEKELEEWEKECEPQVRQTGEIHNKKKHTEEPQQEVEEHVTKQHLKDSDLRRDLEASKEGTENEDVKLDFQNYMIEAERCETLPPVEI